MSPGIQTQITQRFEWDAPWNVGLLATIGIIFVVWTVWQLVREGFVSRLQWWILFAATRTTVAGILLWMILGPTTVLTHTEIHPRTLTVYLDTSSSMQIQDQPHPLADLRWQRAGDYQVDALTASDRAVFFAAALRQQSIHHVEAIERQLSAAEKQEIVTKWLLLAEKCREWLESQTLVRSLPERLNALRQELLLVLKQDLRPQVEDTGWIAGTEPGDRESLVQRLTEDSDRFAVRCRLFAEEATLEFLSANDPSSASVKVDVPTRLQRAIPAMRQCLVEWTEASKQGYRIRLAQFSETVAALPFENWESTINATVESVDTSSAVRRTNMTELLKQIRDEAGKEDVAAAVIITDGRHTAASAEDPRDVVGQVRVPVYCVPIGHGEMLRDLILRQAHAPNSVIQNDNIFIDGVVTAHRCPGEECDILLYEGKKLVDKVHVKFKAEQDDQRFQFEVPTDKTGRREFRIDVEKLAGEHSAENNSSVVAVDVTDASLRILLADGRARWEHQYLVNLFTRQDTIEMDQLKFTPTRVGTGRLKQRPQFPETVEEWSHYRVVILGDISPRQLSQKSQESLHEFVTHRGGSLIIIAGQNDMPQSFSHEPLEQLLPAEINSSYQADKQGYRVELPAEAKTSDVMQIADDLASTEQVWRETSISLPIYFLSSYNKAKPNSQVFLNAVAVKDAGATVDSPALLCWQTVGAGRVAYFSSPSTYQLRNRNGDKFHHRFWGQLIRWIITRSALTGSKTVRLLADKSHYSLGDTAQITVELKDVEGRPVTDAVPEIDVVSKGDVISNVSLTADKKVPGRFQGTFLSRTDGKFSLRARGHDVERLLKAENYFDPVQVLVDFEPGLDRELADPRNDRPLLELLSEQTGGVVLEPTALAELRQAISLQPRIHETSQRTTLWDRWWCLWVMMACLTLEWLIRKRVGLA
jgi:hypothetical protein